MDNLFELLEGRLRISITDATMMWIVHYAMDRAHGKVKSKEGVIERLNEISKFYELAVIQLEGCMKFVQKEAESSNILDTCHENVLADLAEVRDRLQGRLQDSELALRDKDRELRERFENEFKLKQALEMKERELVSLHNNANLEFERTNIEDVAEFSTLNSPVSRDEERYDGEICELTTHSVDRQGWNIEEKLEPEVRVIDEEINGGIDNKKIEQMGYDIHILKETLQHAFGKMQSAIFLSELGPQEQQLRWTIENEAICTLINGFVKDFKENFEMEMRKQEKQVFIGLSEHLSDLMTEVTCLRNELESFINQDEDQSKAAKGYENSASSSKLNLDCKIPPRARRSLSEGDTFANSNIFPSNVAGEQRQSRDGEPEEDGGNSVAKMIKNHESIIRRKSEEMNWLKREMLSAKGSLTFRREKDSSNLKRRIQEVIVRLDNLIKCNARLVDTFGENGGDQGGQTSTSEILSESVVKNEVNSGFDSLEDVWKKMNNAPVTNTVNDELQNEIRMLKEDAENDKLEAQMREEIYYAVCSEAVKDFLSTLDWELKCFQDVCSLRDDVSTVLFWEMYKEWDGNIENHSIERLIMEEISLIVFSETIKDTVNTANYTLSKLHEVKISENFTDSPSFSKESLEIAEYLVKENVYMVFFREIIDEWKKELDARDIENVIREEMRYFVLVEAAKDACRSFRETESQKQDRTSGDNESVESRGEESLIENLDMLLKCIEEEEDLMINASSEANEQSTQLDPVELEHEQLDEHKIFQALVDENESTFTSVRSKLEKALKQLAMSKTIMSELEASLGTEDGNQERVLDQMIPADTVQDRNFIISQQQNEDIHTDQSTSMFTYILEFSKVFKGFELLAQEELRNKVLRLEEAKHQLDLVVELVASIRKRELLYRTAFIRRSQNLQKAEHEVDLLGDQVDAHIGLLEKIYMTLHQHSSVLQQHFEVSEILKLIRKELIGQIHGSSK
ncbi:putative WPP domain-associated protein [Melia azedarach]|uniref:WPP domain-associated protein n=1 Tax=Melia azedarach TaxID=155640 RepID=A0ACC1YCU2_MELAZ|nr:putative WPP domain-associated protein [Melia azedarach]